MGKRVKILSYFLFLLLAFTAFANDWEFQSRGEHIIPIEISEVSIKKEVIRMKITDDGMIVNVSFVFNSPEAKKKIIGFITPEGGFDEEYDNYNWDGEMHFKDFSTVVNGKTVKSNVEKMSAFYKKNPLSKEEIKKYNVKKYKDSYIYFFEANLKKGENIVEHSYHYSGSGGVGRVDYEYVWTTISKWKNKKVDDFELIIEPGNRFIALPYSFWKNNKKIDWELVGEGKMDYIKANYTKLKEKISEIVYARLKNGYIRYKTVNFSPDEEFRMKEIKNFRFHYYGEVDKTSKGYKIADKYSFMDSEEDMKKLTDKELEIVRNYPYAEAGYDFSKKEIKDYFSQFIWYYPISKEVKIDDFMKMRENADKVLKERGKK
jgi:hypothetical protein